MRVQYPKCAYGIYCKLNPIKIGVSILREVSFYISFDAHLIAAVRVFEATPLMRNIKPIAVGS